MVPICIIAYLSRHNFPTRAVERSAPVHGPLNATSAAHHMQGARTSASKYPDQPDLGSRRKHQESALATTASRSPRCIFAGRPPALQLTQCPINRPGPTRSAFFPRPSRLVDIPPRCAPRTMSEAEASHRAIARWTSRVIPAILAGVAGYGTYVMVDRICSQ